LVGEPEGERSLGIPRNRLEDNIKMNRKETGWDTVNWIHLTLDRDQWQAFVNTVMSLRVAQKAENFLTS
jgi:hypothetical protein